MVCNVSDLFKDAPDTLKTAPIAVFDSGVGGLSVLRSLMEVLPNERFVYVADNAHVPYGDRPQAFIAERTLAVARFCLNQLHAKAFVIACNTATAAAISQVRECFPNAVVVGIEPAVKPAAMQTRTGVLGILATSNTLASEKFRALVQGYAADKTVLVQPCPGLVEFVEQGELTGPDIESLLSRYISVLVGQGADVLVLGCTHYPFLAPLIQRLAGQSVQVLETGLPVARETQRRLALEGCLAEQPVSPALAFYATGNTTSLAQAIEHLLGLALPVSRAAC